MTQVVNLLGGSGLGKSTTAAGVFYDLKIKGKNAELVNEYVKKWAWLGRKIRPIDQPYIFGKQSQLEGVLYGKVDYIVTDSPLILSTMYESFYTGKSIIESAVLEFLKEAESNGVVFHNFLLARNKPFDTRGRYETEETAKKVDSFLREKLDGWKIPYTELNMPDNERSAFILQKIGA